MTTFVALVLLTAIVTYGVFGGADFGTGLWDLTAGGAARGARPRALIEHAIGPVWEANHTWLIFCLVVLWSGFPTAFAAVMTTQYIPLGIAAFGIVLRGSGFAFRKVSLRTAEQRVNGIAFASSSVLTPFCFGAVVGGVASGRVPGAGHGDPVASWLNPTSLLGGVLAVLTCGYLAAVFLSAEADRLGDAALERWTRRRALAAATLAGAASVAGLFVLDADAHRLYLRLLRVGWPCLAVSVLAGVVALGLALRGARPGLVRPARRAGGRGRAGRLGRRAVPVPARHPPHHRRRCRAGGDDGCARRRHRAGGRAGRAVARLPVRAHRQGASRRRVRIVVGRRQAVRKRVRRVFRHGDHTAQYRHRPVDHQRDALTTGGAGSFVTRPDQLLVPTK